MFICDYLWENPQDNATETGEITGKLHTSGNMFSGKLSQGNYTPDLTNMKIHRKMPLNIHRGFPVRIHWTWENPLGSTILGRAGPSRARSGGEGGITTQSTTTNVCSKLFLPREQNNFRSCCPQGLGVR